MKDKPPLPSEKKFTLRNHPITFLLITILSFLVFMGLFNRFFFAPKIFLLLLTILLAVFLGKLDLFYRDWFVFLSFIYLFDTMRGIIYILTCRLDLPVHMLYVIKGDRFLFGEVPSVALQNALLDPNHFTWLEKSLTAIHGTHFIAFLIVGLLIWMQKPHAFPLFKKAFYWVTFLGVLGYGIIPTAPPWIASKYLGMLPELLRFNAEIYNMTIPDITSGFNTNPIAAMPSLHTAFPVLGSLILWKLYRWKASPFIVYTLIVLFTIIYTSDHYVVDILAGALLAFFCYLLVFKINKNTKKELSEVNGKDQSPGPSWGTKKIFLVGTILLIMGISLGLYNKHQFVSDPDHYDLRIAPTYVDLFKNKSDYEQNHKVQMYFGGYYLLRKEYKKALSYYEQAQKTANHFVEEKLAELKIQQTMALLDPKP